MGFQDKLHSMTPPKTLIWEMHSMTPSLRKSSFVIKKNENQFKEIYPNKKVMSDTNECCVCYEATEHLTHAITSYVNLVIHD